MPLPEKKQCHFCLNDVDFIDWKDHETLRNFLTHQYKIAPRKRTGVCAKHHRRLSRAIKRARIAALIPFTPRKR
jgi:small subunit ribosomal protein S18